MSLITRTVTATIVSIIIVIVDHHDMFNVMSLIVLLL